MARTKPRVYVDADVFVSVLKNEESNAMSVSVLEAAERKDIQLIASRLLPIEIGAYKGDVPGEKAADDFIERYLDTVEAEWVELDVLIARDARRISWAWSLRTGDAIHLATAIRRKATHFMTLDGAFPMGRTVEGVHVSRPRIVWDPTLLDGEKTA